MQHTIQQVARAAGTTARTLRHYDELGLVKPSHVGANGYRYYDDRAIVRLQRVLLLRELGLGLDAIGEVLQAQDGGGKGPAAEARILRTHLELLHAEQRRLTTQVAAVERTIRALTDSSKEQNIMNQNIFDGFDHTQHREEVERRWGADAYAASDRWWRELGQSGQEAMQDRVQQLNAAWVAAATAGLGPTTPEAQQLAANHLAWLREVPGTPADFAGYVRGLADMYVQDERFAANYGGVQGATLVRDALVHLLDTDGESRASGETFEGSAREA